MAKPLHGNQEKEEQGKVFDGEADDEQPPDEDETTVIHEPLLVGEGAEDAPPPAEPAEETKSGIRKYIVLREYEPPGARTGSGKLWEEVEVVSGTGQGQVLRSLGEEKLKPGSGKKHVAVPSRSWNPEVVVVDTVTTISIGS